MSRQGVPPARTRLAAGERREVVIGAAARRFGANGYDATTIEQIAAAAGVTKPIVYRHFDSKKTLYLAILGRHRADLPRFLDGLEPAPGTPAEQSLRPILERWFEYVAVNSHAWEMLFRDRGGGDEIQALRLAVSRRARDVLADLIRAGGGGVDDDRVEPTAETLRSGLAGLALWSIDHPEVDRAILVDVALRMSAPAFEAEAVDLPAT